MQQVDIGTSQEQLGKAAENIKKMQDQAEEQQKSKHNFFSHVFLF